MSDLSIIIASFETQALLARCLASIEAAVAGGLALELDIIVVDNGSRDQSLEVVSASALAPRLIALRVNRGFAVAMNRGIACARGRHVLLLNSDVEVDRTLLEGAVALLDQEAQIGVIGPGLLHPDGRAQRSVHTGPSLASEFWPASSTRVLWRRPSEHRNPEGAKAPVRDVEAVRGAAFFIHGAVLAKLGGLDERFFFFLEETDYCLRVRRAGHRVVFMPELTARHALGASSKARAPLATRIEYHRSLYRFLALHHGRRAAALVRLWRGLRNGLLLFPLAVGAVFSRTARRRFQTRIGLVLWHLRGCPSEPSFAQSLRSEPVATP